MNRMEQDRLAAEIGMALPKNIARDEAMQRHGYDPLPEMARQAQRMPIDKGSLAKKPLPLQPRIDAGVEI